MIFYFCKKLRLMTKKTFYKIFPEEKIIIEYFSGKAKWNDLVELKQKEIDEINYNPNYSVITDIRNAELDLNALEEIVKYLDFLHSNSKSIGSRKTAALTNNKEQVIHSEMLKIMKNNLPIDIKSFSTLEAIFDWLKLNQAVRNKMTKVLDKLYSETIHSTTKSLEPNS